MPILKLRLILKYELKKALFLLEHSLYASKKKEKVIDSEFLESEI